MLLGLDGLNYKRKIAMTEPTREQAWKEEARKAYQDQQSQDNEGGCRESIGFVQGYLAAKKSDFEEIKTLKEQLADEIKQREKAEKTLLRLSKSGDGSHKDKHASFYDCLSTLQFEFDERKNLAMHYFSEKEKRDKENKDEK